LLNFILKILKIDLYGHLGIDGVELSICILKLMQL